MGYLFLFCFQLFKFLLLDFLYLIVWFKLYKKGSGDYFYLSDGEVYCTKYDGVAKSHSTYYFTNKYDALFRINKKQHGTI